MALRTPISCCVPLSKPAMAIKETKLSDSLGLVTYQGNAEQVNMCHRHRARSSHEWGQQILQLWRSAHSFYPARCSEEACKTQQNLFAHAHNGTNTPRSIPERMEVSLHPSEPHILFSNPSRVFILESGPGPHSKFQIILNDITTGYCNGLLWKQYRTCTNNRLLPQCKVCNDV